jgi:monofunctional glycosyltransferase
MLPRQYHRDAPFPEFARAFTRAFSHAFTRRLDRSLGWAYLESRQTAALERSLAKNNAPFDEGAGLPHMLMPFPPRESRRPTLGRVAKLVLAWLLAIQFCYLLATAILISAYRYVDPPATVLMAYRKFFFGWELRPPKPLPLKQIPRYVRSMLVSVEDGKFYEHHGLDFEAFQRAREINKRLGKPLYGGSTLTMQVARTLFLVPEKSYIRKYLEILTALELEALLPKTRILELYFGYAEWGKGIFGIEAAARKWYGLGVASLSRDEAARLIALLSSPIKYKPDTLYKNGILRERYSYLSARFDSSSSQAEASASAEGTPAPAAPQSTAEAPPPSVEPGVEADAPTEAAPPAPSEGLQEAPALAP